jgi:hypothetical protein
MFDVLIMLPNLIFDSPGSGEKDQHYLRTKLSSQDIK